MAPGLAARRVFMDRAFRVAGLVATFFGLFMLLVFFVQLGRDMIAWFRTRPVLIEQHNQQLRADAAEASDTQAFVERGLQGLDRDLASRLQASDPEEREKLEKRYREVLRPRKQRDLEQRAQEMQQGVQRIRENASPPAVLGHFLSHGPSNEPQDAGILPALLGSLWLAVITVIVAVPLGVGTAVYLEEYRSQGWLARIIQININNLAGVPSVVYGILGAFVFVELVFKRLEGSGMAARNVLGGGLTLALLTLPVIIVSAQEAIRAVPVSIRHGAFALGATRWQVIWHHVLPLALPGILTGAILAMSRALGEAAPLVLFGALLFVDQQPSLFSRFTVLPMQIFGWADRPEDAWRFNAAMASILLLLLLLALNGAAIYLRQRVQQRTRW